MNDITTYDTGRNKVAGIGGLVFLITVILENFLRGAPIGNNSPISEIVNYYQVKQSSLAISHSLYILTIPSLLLYASGLFRKLHSMKSDMWARTGWGAANIVIISFSLVVMSDIVLTNISASGTDSSLLILMLFKIHAAAFIINGAVLGTVMIGFGMAAYKIKIFAKWLSILAIIGGILLILSAIPADAVLAGSLIGIPGFVGFLIWLIWLAVTSVKLIKN